MNLSRLNVHAEQENFVSDTTRIIIGGLPTGLVEYGGTPMVSAILEAIYKHYRVYMQIGDTKHTREFSHVIESDTDEVLMCLDKACPGHEQKTTGS